MNPMKVLCLVSLILVLVGAINWAVVANNPDNNLVTAVVGEDNANIVYYLVGAAAVVTACCAWKTCKHLL
jgi:uncharacterized membrane protein YuzA (DUF378 family)